MEIFVHGALVHEVEAGQEFTIECRTSGGNPDPSLVLLVDKQQVGETLNRNIRHTRTVEKRNSDCEIECSARNAAMESDETSRIHLAVLCKCYLQSFSLFI